MQLRQALSDIAEIRAKLDRAESYRGFRSVAIGLSSLFVMVGALVQDGAFNPGWLEWRLKAPHGYLRIWLVVALASLVVTATEMLIRGWISGKRSTWRMHGKLMLLICPSFVAAAVLTAVICINRDVSSVSTDEFWLLPGLWSIVYGLGLVSCCLHLHRSTFLAANYYLVAGTLYFYLNWTARELAPWHMVAIFGVGQLLLGGLLYWNVERNSNG